MAALSNALRPERTVTAVLHDRWRWLLALGIVQLVTGLMALVVPAVASFVALGLFSAILLIEGVFHLAHAVQARRWSGFALHFVGGLLYVAAGAIVLFDPLNGVATLMLVIGVLFVVDGVVRVFLGWMLRPGDGWGWFVAGGLMSMVLGALLLFVWPESALWIVGMLFAINLLFSGAATIALALRCRASRPDSAAPASDNAALA